MRSMADMVCGPSRACYIAVGKVRTPQIGRTARRRQLVIGGGDMSDDKPTAREVYEREFATNPTALTGRVAGSIRWSEAARTGTSIQP